MPVANDVFVTVRLTREQREQIEQFAKANNTSKADYIRTVVFDNPILYYDPAKEARRENLTHALRDLQVELIRQGTNINQIAHRLNKTKHNFTNQEMQDALEAYGLAERAMQLAERELKRLGRKNNVCY